MSTSLGRSGADHASSRRAYELRHLIGLEETNLVGNVYYTHYLRWQGRCREMFLRDHAPDTVVALSDSLVFVTTYVSCEYFAELRGFEEVSIRMYLAELAQNRVRMDFEYYHPMGDHEELVARGQQEIACMRRKDGKTEPAPIPEDLRHALRPFAAMAQ